MDDITFRRMTAEDYPAIYALWQRLPGFSRGLRSLDDSEEGILKFLKRNPTTCFVVELGSEVIGGILAGHDGRRGYIYHAVVLPEHQGKGIGKELIYAACDALKSEGITKAGLLVFAANDQGNAFWEIQGWQTRPDLIYRNKSLNDDNI